MDVVVAKFEYGESSFDSIGGGDPDRVELDTLRREHH